jgi:DedD protein
MARDQRDKLKRFYFHRAQLVTIALAFAIAAAIIFFLGIINGKAITNRAITGPAALAVRMPAPPRSQPDPPPESQAQESRASRDSKTTGMVTAGDKGSPKKPQPQEKTAEKSIPKSPPRTVESAPRVPEKSGEKAAGPARPERISPTSRTAPPGRNWTVQIKSSPDKKFADDWVARLKSKGYDAFVVQADVEGKTWYRIRVGHLATRPEAESLRSTLESKEKLGGTFLTQTE